MTNLLITDSQRLEMLEAERISYARLEADLREMPRRLEALYNDYEHPHVQAIRQSRADAHQKVLDIESFMKTLPGYADWAAEQARKLDAIGGFTFD